MMRAVSVILLLLALAIASATESERHGKLQPQQQHRFAQAEHTAHAHTRDRTHAHANAHAHDHGEEDPACTSSLVACKGQCESNNGAADCPGCVDTCKACCVTAATVPGGSTPCTVVGDMHPISTCIWM